MVARFAGLIKPLAKYAKLSARRTFNPKALLTSAGIDTAMNAGFGFAFTDGDFGERMQGAMQAATAPESLATLAASPALRFMGGVGDQYLGRAAIAAGNRGLGKRLSSSEGAFSLANVGDITANIATPAIVSSLRQPPPPETVDEFAARGVDPLQLMQISQDPDVLNAILQAAAGGY